MLVVELELGGWSPGRRRSPARPSSPAMLLVELSGWPPGRQRSPARPSSPACSWSSSSSAAGHQVAGLLPDRARARRLRARRLVHQRSVVIAGAPSSPACSWSAGRNCHYLTAADILPRLTLASTPSMRSGLAHGDHGTHPVARCTHAAPIVSSQGSGAPANSQFP
jgi:hypothetical protein